MDTARGSLSPDRLWMWDGTRWVTAFSADGRWWWNGNQWIPVTGPRVSVWRPPWRTRDTTVLLVWLLALPFVLGGATLALATLTTLTPLGVLFGVLSTYAMWAGIGGAVVRPYGSWWEVLLLTGVLLALIVVTWVVALVLASTVQQPQAGDDDGAAVGLVLTLVFVFPPTLLAVSLGKVIRRHLPF